MFDTDTDSDTDKKRENGSNQSVSLSLEARSGWPPRSGKEMKMKPSILLILVALVSVSTSVICAEKPIYQTFSDHTKKALADSPSIEKTVQSLQLEALERDRQDSTFRLKDEIKDLENTLHLLQEKANISWNSASALAKYNERQERHELVVKMLTLRFQIALERYMIQVSSQNAEKNNDPNKPTQPTSHRSEVDR